MKKLLKNILLSVLAAGGLYLCGVFVLFVTGAIFEVKFDNIWLAAVYVAVMASVILIISSVAPIIAEKLDERKKKKKHDMTKK